MFSPLPIVFFLLLCLIYQKKNPKNDWRHSFLTASLVGGVMVVAVTEILSLFHGLTYPFVAGFWCAGILVVLFIHRKVLPQRPFFPFPPYRPFSIGERLLLVAVFLITLAVGVVAWVAPPNTYDSMTYHMSRVVHWIQNGSVAFYPTSILRQLHQNPWAEFAILQFQILSGGDRFANLVQWFSMVGSLAGISLLAKKLGVNARGQVLAVVFTATLPMGLMQGSSTQTDYAVSYWLVCFFYFLLCLKTEMHWRFSLAAGAALGLAILTKATAYLFALPFGIWIGLSLILSHRRSALKPYGIIIVVALALNLGHFSRNFDLYGNPLGPGREGSLVYTNEIFNLSSLTSNVIRNIALHIGTPFPEVNSVLERGIGFLHRFIGISAGDPRTTWASFHIPPLSYYDDNAGNPLHLLLFVVCMIIFLIHWRKNRELFFYLLSIIAAFLLFCLSLKWQPWNSRLHLPLFVLGAALVGYVMSQACGKRGWIANLTMVILVLGALPGVLNNPSRPMIGDANTFIVDRDNQYFTNRPSLLSPYAGVARYLAGTSCKSIGLILGEDDWEYPLLVLLQEYGGHSMRMEHVNVFNGSKRIGEENPYFADFQPCAVIIVNSNPPPEIFVKEINYMQKWFSDPIGVYMRP